MPIESHAEPQSWQSRGGLFEGFRASDPAAPLRETLTTTTFAPPLSRRHCAPGNDNDITGDILDAAVKIHRHFGPGMLESVYERLLETELLRRGHAVERQKPVSFEYEGQVYQDAFRVDLFVDGKIVVELKATETMNKLYPKQVRTYLVAMGLPLGVLVNFGMDRLVDGFVRVVNGYEEPKP